MNLPEYQVNTGSEAAWTAVAAAVGTLVGAILAAFEVDAAITGAAVGVAAALTRWVIGHFLPSPKAG